MKSAQFIKALALLTALALPTFFASTAYASSCGACVPGTGPITGEMNHTAINLAKTACTTCHTASAKPAIPAFPGKPTIPAVPATPASPATSKVVLRPTSESCGACVVGSAPSSVSAHRNVNSTNTACSACHGATGGGSTGGHHSGGDSDHHGTTGGGTTGDHSDHHQISPGNSAFGHSHKHEKK